MDDILAKDYAKKSTSLVPLAKTWYIFHHGFFNPNKPTKIRVVFQFLADVGEKSISKILNSDPDFINQLT